MIKTLKHRPKRWMCFASDNNFAYGMSANGKIIQEIRVSSYTPTELVGKSRNINVFEFLSAIEQDINLTTDPDSYQIKSVKIDRIELETLALFLRAFLSLENEIQIRKRVSRKTKSAKT